MLIALSAVVVALSIATIAKDSNGDIKNSTEDWPYSTAVRDVMLPSSR